MAADALAPYVARTSAAMILTMQNMQVLVLLEEGFFKYLCQINVEEWHKMKIYVNVPSEKFSM